MPVTLSIVVPIYNERDTWRETVARLDAADLCGVDRQIILIDDFSTDGTREQLQSFAADRPDVIVQFHPHNLGKGAAVRTGFATATGDFVVVQDADLEYDPADLPALLRPLLAGDADVVYGSRFSNKIPGQPAGGTVKPNEVRLGRDVAERRDATSHGQVSDLTVPPRRSGRLSNYLANKFLTWLSNRTTGLGLTDMETCYKMFRRDVLERIALEQDRFGFEPEVTAKVAALGVRVCERPISYSPRTHRQGKKIGLSDGIEAIRCIFRYRPSRPARGS